MFEELRVASRGGIADYSGITWEKIDRQQGVFWPCPSADHAGTLVASLDPMPPAGVAARISKLFFNTNERDLPALTFEHQGISPVERLQLVSLPTGRAAAD